MISNGGPRRADSDLVDSLPERDISYEPPDTELVAPDDESELTQVPTSDLVERINDADGVSGDDRIVTVSDDGIESSGDIAGPDVIDFGLSSDASLGGLGVNIDDLPGDEAPISRGNRSVE